jgi:hypothetical protein
MKKQTTKPLNQVIRSLSVTILFLFILQMPFKAKAQDSTKPGQKDSATISYLGDKTGQLLFQVRYENPAGKDFIVAIHDQQGNVLFMGKFRERSFSRKFQLDGSEVEEAQLTFSLSSGAKEQKQSFRVNSNIRLMEEVVVTRL